MQRIDQLIDIARSYNPKVDVNLIKKAYGFALETHNGQKRLSGEDFIIHPFSVAEILANQKLDSTSIAVGLLHDTIEDAGVTYEQLAKIFGKEIAQLVSGVTKISGIRLQGSLDEEFVENLRRMLLAMARDLRVILVKLADRLHNMQTLHYLPKEKQQRIARQTLEIYAPLSERLGMGEMKGELEDYAFPYVYPEEYKFLTEFSRPYYRKAEGFLKNATREIRTKLAVEDIEARVSSRSKHLYSLWKKLNRPEINKDINKVHDLVALRILVNDIKDCYAALGIVHSIWKPVPWIGVSDFIAQPKPNGYRSIHTKVFSLHERILEIQIRTFQMHEQAENGIASHWYYAGEKAKGVSDERLEKGIFTPGEKLSWVKQLVSWQKQVVDSQEYLNALKFDGLASRIFVFSPKGDVYDLPFGATPVDFAYAVHTNLGDETVGSKVNGKMVTLNYKLKSGDMVEIIKKEGTKPTEGWLDFVVTSLARRKISSYFREKNRQI